MIQLGVTDTHALVWWARGERRRLGRRAKRVFEHVEAGRAALYVPVLVLVEVSELARRGVIELRGGFEAWTRGLLESGRFFAADLTAEVVVRAETLYGIPERTDRLIGATAAVLGHPLVTKDVRIGEAGIEMIW